jgi:hypothetical protein
MKVKASFGSALGSLVLFLAGPTAVDAVLVQITPTDPASATLTDHIAYTFTIVLADDGSEMLESFSAVFTSNTMNQVNPGGQPTIWLDNGNIPEDSQFLFPSSAWPPPRFDEAERAGPSPPGLLSATAARGAMPDLIDDFALARVVIPETAAGNWQITVRVNEMNMALHPPGGGVFGVPEASQVLAGATLAVGAIGACFIRRLMRRAMPA